MNATYYMFMFNIRVIVWQWKPDKFLYVAFKRKRVEGFKFTFYQFIRIEVLGYIKGNMIVDKRKLSDATFYRFAALIAKHYQPQK